ncbi:hypothetical protein SAMN05421503_2449 [Terribacillus aidingensis]|uniref:Uncharacterized protein n=1 Tax=Terribacillus aidingensis TaxID=586416 RepID=A0A285NZS5_9BACI|nr:hypothetical protein [Terribacillus aidingensis]SNZ14527.1 hypothetical protein SAMN05421503_2449 [Terribacillus aidingensis]
MEKIHDILQKIRKFNGQIEDIERMEECGIDDVTVASVGSNHRSQRYALDLSELGIDKKYVTDLLSPILTAKLAEQKSNLKVAIFNLSKELQELAGGDD